MWKQVFMCKIEKIRKFGAKRYGTTVKIKRDYLGSILCHKSDVMIKVEYVSKDNLITYMIFFSNIENNFSIEIEKIDREW